MPRSQVEPAASGEAPVPSSNRRLRWGRFALALVAIGFVWVAIIVYRASTALPGRSIDYAKQVVELEQSVQPPDGPDAWPVLMRASKEFEAISRKYVDASRDERPTLPLDALYCAQEPPGAEDERVETASKSYAEIMAGVIPSLLEEVARAPRCMRPKATGLVLREDLQLSYVRPLAQLNRVRMRNAAQRNDEAEFLRAIEINVALARHIARQTWIIDRLTSNAIIALTAAEIHAQSLERDIPASTCTAILALLDKYSDLPSPSHAFRGERLMALDAIQATHSDDGAGSGIRLPLALEPRPSGLANVLGLYYARKNNVVDAAEKAYQQMQTLADASRAQRAGLRLYPEQEIDKLGPRYAILQTLMPGASAVYKSNDQTQMRLAGLRVVLAIEAYRRTHANVPPESLDALVPALLEHLPNDPFAGDGMLRYRVLKPSDDTGRTYLLYSVAADGTDDHGTPSKRDPLHAFLSTGLGTDFILNEPRSTR